MLPAPEEPSPKEVDAPELMEEKESSVEGLCSVLYLVITLIVIGLFILGGYFEPSTIHRQ